MAIASDKYLGTQARRQFSQPKRSPDQPMSELRHEGETEYEAEPAHDLEPFERRILEHQAPLAPVGREAHGDDTAGSMRVTTPSPSERVPDGVARCKLRDLDPVAARWCLPRRRRIPRPRGRAQALARNRGR